LIRNGDNNSGDGVGGEKIYNSQKKELVLAFLLESYPELITISTDISGLFSYPTSH